jgi:hypothetical protein
MAVTNILLNKTATASSCILPFSANRVNNGNSTDPISRWMASVDTTPAWVTIDAGASYFVNRWVARFMGGAGWSALGNYNPASFSFYSSVDNATWTLRDTVTGNTGSSVDRTLTIGFTARYFRIAVASGPTINPRLASVVEFEVYNASATTLSNLVLSAGSLTPAFNPATLVYTSTVPFATTSTTVTPTVFDPNSTVTVNGTAVVSGQASGAINLNVGTNTITVVVLQAGIASTTYTITVTRQDSTYLSALALQSRSGAITLTPIFVKTTQSYNASVANNISAVTFTPTAENSASTITINGTTVVSGQISSSLTLNEGNNTFTIAVTSSGTTFTYTVVIARAYNLLLNKIDIAYIYRGGSGSTSVTTDATNLNYSVNLPNNPSTMTIAPFAASTNIIVKVNGVVVTSGTPSASIAVTSGMVVTITVSTPDNTLTRSYNLTVTK